jgi:hypothetical protein
MALNIYTVYGKIPDGLQVIHYNDAFFYYTTLDDSEFVRMILKRIDEAEYNDASTFIGRDKEKGAIYKEHLSTGAKTILNVLKHPDKCFDICECGFNCIDILLELSPKIQGNIYWRKPIYGHADELPNDLYCDGVHYDSYADIFEEYFDRG